MAGQSTKEVQMRTTIAKVAAGVAALVAFALGGAALAGAADKSPSTPAATGTTTQGTRLARPPQQELSSDVAAKVKAAALKKVPGATVLRTEAGGPYGTAYHAHIRTSDGTEQVVLVNADFEATAVQADPGRGPGRGHGRGGPGGGETALTGDTKAKVEAAVLAKYPGATIVRTETKADGTAPYESHIRTKASVDLEVLVSSTFQVVDAREGPAHP
jgi:uncharacterized membrane protein YkoI